jgi:ribonuclease HII
VRSSKKTTLPQLRPDFSFEDTFKGIVCGVDEAGRGPLAGPVVAAAVVLKRKGIPSAILEQINDSKKLSAKKREYLFCQIHDHAHVSIAECSVEEIDKINILQASLLAMKKAIEALEIKPAAALIDGIHAPKTFCAVKTIIEGDGRSLSIAAASIVAKHHRDLLMHKHALEFPQYGWGTNAGYGTPQHLKAIEIHGITHLHRRSFSPISDRILKENSANN